MRVFCVAAVAGLQSDVWGLCSRDDKRYTEKKNKSERARRKKEDIARLRGLVDLALSVDPRIKRIKQEEKDAREAKKKGKNGAVDGMSAKEKAEAEKKKAEEEAKLKEEEEKVCSVVVLSCARCLNDAFSSRSPALKRRKRKLLLPTLRRRLVDKLARTPTEQHDHSFLLLFLSLPLPLHCLLCTTDTLHAFPVALVPLPLMFCAYILSR